MSIATVPFGAGASIPQGPRPTGPDYSGALVKATGATTARTLAARFADVANILDFGADPTGMADSSAAFNAAAATGKTIFIPPSLFRINNPIVTQPAQKVIGCGRTASVLFADGGWNFASNPAHFLSLGHSSSLEDFGLSFNHGSPTTRSDLMAFPPAIYSNAVGSRFQLTRIRLSGAMIGIQDTANCPFNMDTVEIGAYSTGLWVDGPQDFCFSDNLHFWNFGCILSIYSDGNTQALKIGRIDGWAAGAIEIFNANVDFINPASTINLPFLIDTLMLDGACAVTYANPSRCKIGKVYNSGNSPFQISDGQVAIGELHYAANPTTVPFQVTGGSLHIRAGDAVYYDQSISFATVSAGILDIGTLHITPPTGAAAQTVPLFAQTAGVMQIGALTIDSGTTPAGAAVSYGEDNAMNRISGAANLNGWTIAAPALGAGNYGVFSHPPGDSTSLQIGSNSLWSLPSGTRYNVALGYSAMGAAQASASANTAVGSQALQNVTTGSANTAIGENSGAALTTGADNAFIGTAAGQAATSSRSVGVGFNALLNDAGGQNVAIGWSAGQAITTGGGNICIGDNAGATTLATGGQNVLIGFGVDAPAAGTNYYVNISGLITGYSPGSGAASISLNAGTIQVGALPTTKPTTAGYLWNNAGVVNVS